jgi:hypothetical protein
MLPEAPVLAACGVEFDVVEADARVGRAALARLDRLGVPVGPITLQRLAGSERMGWFVRVGSAALAGPLLDADGGPRLFGVGTLYDMPQALEISSRPVPPAVGRAWLRLPSEPRSPLPAAHVILGTLALVSRAPAAGRVARRDAGDSRAALGLLTTARPH